MNDERTKKIVKAHLKDGQAIIEAIARNTQDLHSMAENDEGYQGKIHKDFKDIINSPTVDFISKMSDSWLIVGDHRAELDAKIQLVIERYGLGVGMIVLHAQQLNAGHVPTKIEIDGTHHDLLLPTEILSGARKEKVLNVPIRRFRGSFDKLAKLSIAKPRNLCNEPEMIKHKNDKNYCFYCSCSEMNPLEVVVNYNAKRFGFSRNYTLGFTFAPFGNPLNAVHFLAWDRAESPLNMNRTPITVSDLVKMTRDINISIRQYFAGTGIEDIPTIDGVSNGWAGNTIYHQHFQFFQPEYKESPVNNKDLILQPSMLERDDVKIHKIDWAAPFYRIEGSPINVGFVGNDMAGIWRILGGTKKVKHLKFYDGFTGDLDTEVPVFTQNLYVPGADYGRTAHIILRDRERILYKPRWNEKFSSNNLTKPQGKENIGVMEATGVMIVDDEDVFEKMKSWTPSEVTEQINKMAKAICPNEEKINKFEEDLIGLYPP